ncbi:MAG: beta-glucuronidase [Planctomycetes bacterium GWF2_41_51]|nr:MAG: beta-glucuronidase [Planctomycetes bacterium GWF2_41_51]HBG28571.1 beta-glucuronidase [Phycisphaerales bacterium]
MLYPRESETRQVKDLSGIWNFKIDKNNEGFVKKWFSQPLGNTMEMPVPASYNDITQDKYIRDHVGYVWYEKVFFVPKDWRDCRTVLRVGSASHHATVWINGKEVVSHRGGFLPFEGDISEVVQFGNANRVTLAVDNTLDNYTLPRGEIQTSKDEMHPENHRVLVNFCDFYNYSGIHRPVRLILTPKIYIADVIVTTDINETDGIIDYKVIINGSAASIQINLLDKDGHIVIHGQGAKGRLEVKNAKLWEPRNAYLYTMEMKAFAENGSLIDVYRLPVGIRTIKVTDKQFLINGKPFYFKGFGKHEDSDIRGKGHDDVINTKDFNLMKWIGANSFRTSHYPYSEEIMNMADRLGIVVIDECPAVGLGDVPANPPIFTEERINGKGMEHHLQVMREMIQRDKNHPCVVMWSLANESSTWEKNSIKYFKRIIDETRKLDPTRMVTIVLHSMPGQKGIQPELRERGICKYLDVVCVNRYFSWYLDSGQLDLIPLQLEYDMKQWYKRFNKPVLLTEYGADTIAGLHQDPPVMFTEEYQCEMLDLYHKTLDKLDFAIGEHVWNFADFATKQRIVRAVGNKKGIFTRQRQPKSAAFLLKKRWENFSKY